VKHWTTNGSAWCDTRVRRLELWCVERGHLKFANLLARLRQ
jgi:hypothetical protein